MAEAILSEVIIKLTCVIAQNIADEIRLQRGVANELASINSELQIMSPFLRDAEDRAERSDLVKAWLKQVREAGYKIEDVIDEHVMLPYIRQQNQAKNKCLRLSLIIPRIFKELKGCHDISNTIADIKDEVSELQQRKTLYGLQAREQGVNIDIDTDTDTDAQIWHDPRLGFLYSRDINLVGIEDPKNEILELLDLETRDSKCSVISIVGIGGIGKTTLAWKVYDNIEVKRHFYVHTWVNVTQSYC